jgi:predicted nucleotidyltransferase
VEHEVPSDTAIDRLRALLERQPVPGVVSAYVFGSLVDGRANRQSDADLGVLLDRAVYPDEAVRFDAQLVLRSHLSPAAVGREVDLVVLNDAPPLLGRRIVRGLQVYCASPAIDHAFHRDVQLRAADLEPFIRAMRRRLLAYVAP